MLNSQKALRASEQIFNFICINRKSWSNIKSRFEKYIGAKDFSERVNLIQKDYNLDVNQEGVVYQKDLGKNTAKVAKAIKRYDPDNTWTKVEETKQ